jgi:hypothetical protein
MSRTLPTLAKTALFAQQTGAVLPFLIDIVSSAPAATFHLVNNTEAVTYGGQEYLPFPFKLDPPDETSEQISNARLTICAVDLSLIEAIRNATGTLTMTAIAVIVDGANVEALVPWTFTMRSISYNAETISADLIYEDRLQNLMPKDAMTPQNFPGLF